MKILVGRYLAPLLLGAFTLAHAAEDKDIVIRRTERHGPKIVVAQDKEGKPMRDLGAGEKEVVTFLGVETAPLSEALASQLGLAPEMGLVVTRLSPDSPASAVLKEHDVLTKFDDQLLVDQRQLRVLVRAKKEGDEVALTAIRGGKEIKVKAKLTKQEVPKLVGFRDVLRDAPNFRFFGGDGMGAMNFEELPGLAREDVDNALRMLRENHGAWFGTGPGVRVFSRQGGKDTILNLNQGNFVYSDDDGSVTVNAESGNRQLTVKDPSGKTLFDGPINNDDERKALPPEIRQRVDKIQSIHVGGEPGEDFHINSGAVEAPVKTSAPVPQPGFGRGIGRSFRSF